MQNAPANMRCRDAIPAEFAASLHAAGYTWAAIGRALALNAGRSVPYQPRAVATAVRNHQRAAAS